MNKLMRIPCAALGLCAICGWIIWLVATVYAVNQLKTSQQDYQYPVSEIDEKAKAVNGADESAIRELADAVFRDPTSLGIIPDVVARPFKKRLIRSEINYRSGVSSGVSEERIVWLIDRLVSEFRTPSYAETSQEEVHDLRVMISRRMPHFIPHQSLAGQSGPDVAGGLAIKPMMSPLEAVLVARVLIEQKQDNDAYLLTPQERENVNSALESLRKEFQLTPLESSFVMRDLVNQEINLYAKKPAAEIVAAARTRSAELGLKQTESVLMAGNSSPRLEAMQAVRLRANALSATDALQLVDRLLDGLGIAR